jgi:ribose transport system substrate-binding protein
LKNDLGENQLKKRRIKKMKKRTIIALLIVFAMLLSTACTGTAPKESQTADAPESSQAVDMEKSAANGTDESATSAYDLVVNAADEAIPVAELDTKLGETPSVTKKWKIGAVVKTLQGTHWQAVAQGYQEMADELGVEIEIQGGQTESDMTGQMSLAEAMIQKDYDALILSPITESNPNPAIEMAIDKKIPIVNLDFEIINEKYPYIHVVGMTDFTPQGQWVAEWFAENLLEGSKVAHIEGLGGAIAANQRKAGFVDTVESMGKLDLVASQPGDWDREKAYNITTNLLAQYPDLAGIYCANDGMAMGAVEAVIAAGIPEAIDAIKGGTMTGTVSAFGNLMGREGVKAVVRLLEGQSLPKLCVTEVAVVTEENVNDYYPE